MPIRYSPLVFFFIFVLLLVSFILRNPDNFFSETRTRNYVTLEDVSSLKPFFYPDSFILKPYEYNLQVSPTHFILMDSFKIPENKNHMAIFFCAKYSSTFYFNDIYELINLINEYEEKKQGTIELICLLKLNQQVNELLRGTVINFTKTPKQFNDGHPIWIADKSNNFIESMMFVNRSFNNPVQFDYGFSEKIDNYFKVK